MAFTEPCNDVRRAAVPLPPASVPLADRLVAPARRAWLLPVIDWALPEPLVDSLILLELEEAAREGSGSDGWVGTNEGEECVE